MNFIIDEHQQEPEEPHTTLHIRSPFDLLNILDSLSVDSPQYEFKTTLQGELTPCPETQFCGPPHVILGILHLLFEENLVEPAFQQLIKAVEKRCDEILYNRNEKYLADPSFTQLVAERGLAVQSQDFCECSRRKLEYEEPSFDVMHTKLIFCNHCGIIEKSMVNGDFSSPSLPPWIQCLVRILLSFDRMYNRVLSKLKPETWR